MLAVLLSMLAIVIRAASRTSALPTRVCPAPLHWPAQQLFCTARALKGNPSKGFTQSLTQRSNPSAASRLFSMDQRAKQVADFWLGEGWENADNDDPRPDQQKIWWGGGPEVDKEIVQRFGSLCEALIAGELDAWHEEPLNAWAGVIVGDQLSRNAYRGTAKMYAADEKVLSWAKELVAAGTDCKLKPIQRVWLIMPYMHSESLADQEECIRLFERLGQEAKDKGWTTMANQAQFNIKFAKDHRDVVAKWGRFPHRNALLGRPNTPEEAEGMANGTIAKW